MCYSNCGHQNRNGECTLPVGEYDCPPEEECDHELEPYTGHLFPEYSQQCKICGALFDGIGAAEDAIFAGGPYPNGRPGMK